MELYCYEPDLYIHMDLAVLSQQRYICYILFEGFNGVVKWTVYRHIRLDVVDKKNGNVSLVQVKRKAFSKLLIARAFHVYVRCKLGALSIHFLIIWDYSI